jgi:hypothetical protein
MCNHQYRTGTWNFWMTIEYMLTCTYGNSNDMINVYPYTNWIPSFWCLLSIYSRNKYFYYCKFIWHYIYKLLCIHRLIFELFILSVIRHRPFLLHRTVQNKSNHEMNGCNVPLRYSYLCIYRSSYEHIRMYIYIHI